jgi:hypothetical protein
MCVREQFGLAFERVEQHVGIAHATQLGPEPLELLAEGFAPLVIEHRAQGAQIAAESPGRHPRLVNGLGILAQPDDRIEGQQLLRRTHERGAHDGLDGRLTPERGRVRKVRRGGRGRAEHA